MQTGKNRKRILIFSTAYYPYVAGAEVAIQEITNRLSSEYDFDLITAKFDKKLPSKEKIGSVNVYRLGSGSIFYDKVLLPFRGAMKAWQLNKQNNYDCIWAMMITFASGAGYILNIMRFFLGQKKIPLVLSLQEGDSENHLNYKWGGMIALSWKLALWQTSFLTGLSNFLLDRAKKYGYDGKLKLVPNGVDLHVFSRTVTTERKEEIELLLNKKQDDVFLVTWSRLTYKNAVDDIISALTHLPKNINLIVMGKGEEGLRLQKKTDNLGLSSRVKFLGFVTHESIPDYLSVCDIFIRPSRSEGFGNSFIEAMAAKIPVIATPVGGIPDFLDDNETGIFCAPNNPQSIAKAVLAILDNPKLKNKIVDNAFKRVYDRYGWDRVSGEMGEVFDNVS